MTITALARETGLLENLNEAQALAVLADDGPLLIIAGAGSGKTRVLTTRIAHLVTERGVDPSSILAITFTNKAAREMKERLSGILGETVGQMTVATFHSALLRILRSHAAEIGRRPGFSIYDTDDSRKAVTNATEDCGLDPKIIKPRSSLNTIGFAKARLLDPVDLRQRGTRSVRKEHIQIYAAYEAALAEANALDFDDILVKSANLFKGHPEILAHYEQRFRHVFVDEYQDTNTAQHEIVKMLTAKHRSICVVGDADQSIYGFRAAEMGNILSFDKTFPDAKTVVLEHNYRSRPPIIGAANGVIAHNIERAVKNLIATKSGGARIEIHRLSTGSDEAAYIATEAKKLVGHGTSGSDIAVLCRSKMLGRGVEQAMIGAEVPCRVIGSIPFFSQTTIRDLLAYLRMAINRNDEIAFRRVVNTPRRQIGQASIAKIRAFARAESIGIGEAMERAGEIGLPKRAEEGLAVFSNLLHQALIVESCSGTVADVLDFIIAETGFIDHLEKQGNDVAPQRLKATEMLLELAKKHETIQSFLEAAALNSETDEIDKTDSRVLIMTIHAAKGLEFPVVFVPGMEEGSFPDLRLGGYEIEEVYLDADQRRELEEERRLAYVAITRARDRLVLSCARERIRNGQFLMPDPSRFLAEIPEEVLTAYGYERPIPTWQ